VYVFHKILPRGKIMKLIPFLAIVGLFVVTGTASLEGLLPPLYQTADEIVAVVKDDELGNVLPDGEPIIGIRKNDNGYLVQTSRHQIQASIIYEPATRPGPAHFKVKFQTLEKINAREEQ
jgi:hypothetical protein